MVSTDVATHALELLAAELEGIDQAIERVDRASQPFLADLPASQLPSATNLLHYLVLRQHDLRRAQRQLAAAGLSSLGRTESHVRSGLDAVLRALHLLVGDGWSSPTRGSRLTLEDGECLLGAHTDALLGPAPDARRVRIMVTMPSEAARDYPLVRDLVAGGMDCMRINCAHDGPEAWGRMIAHVRQATAETGRPCVVCMDIAGPKLRTGDIVPGPEVLRIRPTRDEEGQVVAPAVVALVGASSRTRHDVEADAVLPLDDDPPATCRPGDRIDLEDLRGRARMLQVIAHDAGVVLATLDRTAYITNGTRLVFEGEAGRSVRGVTDLPALDQVLTLHKGDRLLLTPDSVPGRPALRDDSGRVVVPAQIGVTLSQVFEDVAVGQPIWFDDGRIGGVITATEPARLVVEITQARPEGEKLRAGKGINLPETRLRLGALTAKDLVDLDFVVAHADLIGYSFVRSVDDVHALQRELAARGGDGVGIILKIETRHAFDELPRLLLAAMRTGRFGVMIARGDLAIECGYERMAEVQEEILWIAEAAHAPVIWATQVLESLAKTGVPSRAEVSDAAMAERAECVMLNKGPFIREAVRTLDDILGRMQAHQTKKRAMLRPLTVAQAVLAEALVHAAE